MEAFYTEQTLSSNIKLGLYNTEDKVSFGQYKSGDISYAKEIVEKYPEGSKVKVFYDPNNPEIAVLEPKFQLNVVFVFSILGGVIFLCLGVPFIKALSR